MSKVAIRMAKLKRWDMKELEGHVNTYLDEEIYKHEERKLVNVDVKYLTSTDFMVTITYNEVV